MDRTRLIDPLADYQDGSLPGKRPVGCRLGASLGYTGEYGAPLFGKGRSFLMETLALTRMTR